MRKRSLFLMLFSFLQIASAWGPPRGEEQAFKNNLIIINGSFWLHPYSGLIYTTLLFILAVITFRNLSLNKQQKNMNRKYEFLLMPYMTCNSPLHISKTPLEKLCMEKALPQENTADINIAL